MAEGKDAGDLAGRVLDEKYRLNAILGRGGMGVVYRGEQLAFGRSVAIKVLHSHLVQDKEWQKRFQHEAKIASMLHHPNSVAIYDYGVSDGLAYLVERAPSF